MRFTTCIRFRNATFRLPRVNAFLFSNKQCCRLFFFSDRISHRATVSRISASTSPFLRSILCSVLNNSREEYARNLESLDVESSVNDDEEGVVVDEASGRTDDGGDGGSKKMKVVMVKVRKRELQLQREDPSHWIKTSLLGNRWNQFLLTDSLN
ncbi:unnamed protein product [Vicia faba]|uniref:Uncharacterized protein n=1 Tax=Vicia faba TaxID=3906 RepID=A0AAV1AL05_VICFA|nr:unnamed protein product [Vicia faba]